MVERNAKEQSWNLNVYSSWFSCETTGLLILGMVCLTRVNEKQLLKCETKNA